MSEEEQRFLSEKKLPKRSRSNRKGNQNENLDKMNRKLNYLIAIVSVLIIISTVIILNTRYEAPAEEVSENEQQSPEQTETAKEEHSEADSEGVVTVPTEEIDATDNIIAQSADANVIEVWTNDAWQPYPTQQTGNHTSVFEKGNIDYEEKLAAAFSVLPIEQQSSYVLSARNNGDTKSARIVVTNKDKSENYRVIIEWIDGQGWKPVSVDVLHSADGVK